MITAAKPPACNYHIHERFRTESSSFSSRSKVRWVVIFTAENKVILSCILCAYLLLFYLQFDYHQYNYYCRQYWYFHCSIMYVVTVVIKMIITKVKNALLVLLVIISSEVSLLVELVIVA